MRAPTGTSWTERCLHGTEHDLRTPGTPSMPIRSGKPELLRRGNFRTLTIRAFWEAIRPGHGVTLRRRLGANRAGIAPICGLERRAQPGGRWAHAPEVARMGAPGNPPAGTSSSAGR